MKATKWVLFESSLKRHFYFVSARVDKAGHEYCWGCKEYYDELEVIDGYIQGIMKALNETKTSQGIKSFLCAADGR